MRAIARYTLLLLNIGAAALLLLSGLAGYISPAMVWPVALVGLAFPFIAFANLAFLLFWAVQRKFYLFISLVALFLSIGNILSTVQFNFGGTEKPSASAFKVMSFNVRLFDLYNWSHNLETREKIYGLLSAEQADIICFQEFFSSNSMKFNNLDTLRELLGAEGKKYSYHMEITEAMYEDHLYGAATFTSFPVVNKGRISFEHKSHNVCIWSDLLIGTDTVRVYNIHLQSIRFSNEDYKFLENLRNEKDQEEIQGGMRILRRMKQAFIKRASQTELVAGHIRQCPYPVLVCGDFNDPPTSYTYQKLSQGLRDAFVESGWGFSKTYDGAFPSFRIDYILHDKRFRSMNYRTIRQELSDHFPIVCEVEKE